MLDYIDEGTKRRLTERDEIRVAINELIAGGCQLEDLVAEMTRAFYVDLDEFDIALKSAA